MVPCHSLCAKMKDFTLTERNFRQIISRNFFSKNVAFTKFLPKMSEMRINFRNYLATQCGNCCDLVPHIFGKNFVKVTFLLKKLLKS